MEFTTKDSWGLIAHGTNAAKDIREKGLYEVWWIDKNIEQFNVNRLEYLKDLSPKESYEPQKPIRDIHPKNIETSSNSPNLRNNKILNCKSCQFRIKENYNFCTNCGSRTQNKFLEIQWKKSTRNSYNYKIRFFWFFSLLILFGIVAEFRCALFSPVKVLPDFPV